MRFVAALTVSALFEPLLLILNFTFPDIFLSTSKYPICQLDSPRVLLRSVGPKEEFPHSLVFHSQNYIWTPKTAMLFSHINLPRDCD